jgi:3'-phosphoadenosine 5'-phosphosulfate sulfotransferase (PAPS reductase)/FAD synthetase
MMTAVVSISGGKDSQATAILAIDKYGAEGVDIVMADTGHEHPTTMEFVRDYLPGALGAPVEIVRADFSRQIARKRAFIARNWEYMGVPLVQVDRALATLHPTGNPYLDMCMWKGRFPSHMAQFCTHELKRNPIDQFMLDVCGTESWQGIRRDESRNRADALAYERAVLDRPWAIVRPIVEWTAQQTVDFIKARGHRLNPLYSQGMGRVGCMPCINCNKNELNEISKRWPEEVDRVREWEAIVSDCTKRIDKSTFFPLESIDEAVRWSATFRGGREIDPDRLEPSASCSSLYGLCE